MLALTLDTLQFNFPVLIYLKIITRDYEELGRNMLYFGSYCKNSTMTDDINHHLLCVILLVFLGPGLRHISVRKLNCKLSKIGPDTF